MLIIACNTISFATAIAWLTVIITTYQEPVNEYYDRSTYEIVKISKPSTDDSSASRLLGLFDEDEDESDGILDESSEKYIVKALNVTLTQLGDSLDDCQVYKNIDSAEYALSFVNSDQDLAIAFYYIFIVIDVLFQKFMALINILKTIYSKCKSEKKVEPTPNELPQVWAGQQLALYGPAPALYGPRGDIQQPADTSQPIRRNCPKCKKQEDAVSSIEDTIYEKFFDILHVGGSTAVLYPLSQITYGDCIQGDAADFASQPLYIIIVTGFIIQNLFFLTIYLLTKDCDILRECLRTACMNVCYMFMGLIMAVYGIYCLYFLFTAQSELIQGISAPFLLIEVFTIGANMCYRNYLNSRSDHTHQDDL